MRKVDPADVLTDFEAAATELLQYFDRVTSALAGHPTRERDVSILATQSFLALFVAFERFTSDLLLAYLNRDFGPFQTDLRTRLSQSVRDKFGAGVEARVSLQTRQHVPLAEIEQLVDPTGWNVTFTSVTKLKEYAARVLAPNYRTRIESITASEARLIDTARSIRDFIAHQSVASKQKMNDALTTIEQGGHNRHLGRQGNKVNSVGVYLKSNPGGERRLNRYARGLIAVAARM